MAQGQFTPADLGRFRPNQIERTSATPDVPEQAPAAPGGIGTALGGYGYGAVVEPLKGIAELLISAATEGPVTTGSKVGRGLLQAQGKEYQQAQEAFSRGDYGQAIAHGVAWLVPIFGPAVSDIVQEGSQTGDWATATGRLTALGVPLKTPRGARASVPLSKPLQSANPAEAAAVEFGFREGIPMGAGTATGSNVAKGAEWLARRTPAGEIATWRTTQRQADAFGRTGERLAGRAHPGRVTPVEAGTAVRESLESSIERYGAEATTAYDALRTIEAKPSSQRTVRTGTRTVDTGILDASGQPITRTVETTERVALPVDLRSAKRVLKPIYDRWIRQMPITIQRSSPGFKAIENIIKGPDHAPVSVIDADLSAIKSILREADPNVKNVSEGFAASAVAQLESAVQRAVAQGGPEAIEALQRGRTATRAKHTVNDLLRDLVGTSDEPRRAFDASLWSGDRSIGRLKDLRELAPSEVPKLGRAFLDVLFDKAKAEGGFSRTQSLWGEWQKLGPETKRLLYGAELTKELDNFFLLAKKVADNPNPSGSAYAGFLATQGTYMLFDPVMSVAYQIPAGAVAKLLTNQRALKALNRGLRVSLRVDRAGQAAAFGELMRTVGEHIEPVSSGNGTR